MTQVTVQWRPHTETPTGITTALIAVPPGPNDDAGVVLLPGIYFGSPKRGWVNENTLEPISENKFWWLSEVELVAPLEAEMGSQQ